MSDKIIQTYVFTNGKRYFISTIRRATSASMCPPPLEYNETIAWEWPEGGKRGPILLTDECLSGLSAHFRVCEKIYTGNAEGI